MADSRPQCTAPPWPPTIREDSNNTLRTPAAPLLLFAPPGVLSVPPLPPSSPPPDAPHGARWTACRVALHPRNTTRHNTTLQYPLYSASVALYNGTFVGYNLCEERVRKRNKKINRKRRGGPESPAIGFAQYSVVAGYRLTSHGLLVVFSVEPCKDPFVFAKVVARGFSLSMTRGHLSLMA